MKSILFHMGIGVLSSCAIFLQILGNAEGYIWFLCHFWILLEQTEQKSKFVFPILQLLVKTE
ncbi:hypothetical protein GCM10008967_07980 [Bacillus carboniphilus]|uniref:Lipoprotein n=1 Tax=Bacillus carboniphilus TaxID=86663 RepID=A0ABN0VXL5_9BACI